MPIAEQRATVGYRPTVLRLANEHCARAVDHYEAGADYDHSIFAEGVAAHAVLHALGESARRGGGALDYDEVIRNVVLGLATEGRTFEGDPEPPMSMERALAGARLARDWVGMNPLPADAHYELGVAVDEEWQIVPYTKDAWCRLIFDFVRVSFEAWEEGSGIVLHVRDYKSDWPAGRDRLDSLQLKAQAVVAHHACEAGLLSKKYNGYSVLRREIVNLRLGASFVDDIDATEAAYAVARWRKEIELQIEALEHRGEDGFRPASPGGGCMGCPYLLDCQPAQKWLAASSIPKTEWERAVAYTIAVGTVEQLKPLVRADAAEHPIALRDGWFVGTEAKDRLGPTDEAYAAAWAAWEARGGDPRGFAKALRLTKSNLEGVAWALWPGADGRDKRDQFLGANTEPNTVRRFGIFKADKGGND